MSIHRLIQVLGRADRVFLVTHINPDGDGIGSQLALGRALSSRRKEIHLVNPSPIPPDLSFLLEGVNEIAVFDPGMEGPQAGDCLLVLDTQSLDRLGEMASWVTRKGATTMVIDHHQGKPGNFQISYCDPQASSTGELVGRLLEKMKVSWEKAWAQPLLAAIVVDTGFFTYERCTSATYELVSRLVRAGADPYALRKALSWQKPLAHLRLEGEVIGTLQVAAEGRLAWAVVTRDTLQRWNVKSTELGEIVNFPLSLKGVEIALLFIEENEKVRVSARAKGTLPVLPLAEYWGGGGHALASGFSVQKALEEAIAEVTHLAEVILEGRELPEKEDLE